MILNDMKIRQYSKTDNLITPYKEENLQACSYDLTLSNQFSKDGTRLDGEYYTLEPNEFILASTNETLNIPSNLCARVEGKSSLGRIGLMVHSTAGFIDPGFKGSVTLELYNLGVRSIVLHKGARVSQVCFMRLDGVPCGVYGDYGNHYQAQDGVTESVVECVDDECWWVV